MSDYNGNDTYDNYIRWNDEYYYDIMIIILLTMIKSKSLMIMVFTIKNKSNDINCDGELIQI